MFKKTLITLNAAILLALGGIYFLHFRQDIKVAYVNAVDLINNYEGMQVAKLSYQKKAAVWQANLDTLALEADKAIKELQRQSSTPKERQLSEELARTKKQQFIDYQKAIQEKAALANDELNRKAIESINAYLDEYGKRHGYDFILTATEYGNIAFAADAMNITDDVLKGLNASYDEK